MRHAYLFEAKGIQPYLAAGGRLADALGASLLVDGLCRPGPPHPQTLDRALLASGLDPASLRWTRRAAGAFGFVTRDAARLAQFRTLWTLAVQHAAPGLAFQECWGQGATAQAALRDALRQARARRAILGAPLPLAGPLNSISPRTGLPALATAEPRLSTETEAEWLERAMLDAAQARKQAQAGSEREAVAADRFAPAGHQPAWPRDMEEEFPFRPGQRQIGVVHVDVNRMGLLLRALAAHHAKHAAPSPPDAADWSAAEDAYLEDLAAFSRGVEAALEEAAQSSGALLMEAHEADLEAALKEGRPAPGFYPARPIILGGDDALMILRADLALSWARHFLEAFQAAAARLLGPLCERLGAATPTACAGIALVGASRPFSQASQLAMSLCRHAKSWAKRQASSRSGQPRLDVAVPSSLTFHRATAALPDDFVPEPFMTACPYVLADMPIGQANDQRFPLQALESLRCALASAGGRSAARELAALVAEKRYSAGEERLERWIRQLRRHGATPERKAGFDTLAEAAEAFGIQLRETQGTGAPDRKTALAAAQTGILADALAWLAAVGMPEE